jgi:hypothetical protein
MPIARTAPLVASATAIVSFLSVLGNCMVVTSRRNMDSNDGLEPFQPHTADDYDRTCLR